ncbi:hypothetical protein DFA_06444 [Cavenderia fasciculata]|uniref:IPT/TIG domain-containing protein n=1 Tax=Cavenderia fasciculata TaxID=261658 RepID=F4PJ08_CACFS|nr:uncharacterized protein DFA_06444 [Cavenderia fasciculata]EGG24294.1 hypothetical protein DFA_06444 [Cavenderia fasciculata]|eukprot:XP_004362145.1 hypothetical protein DFA_06444 [Cavenderia fasciculata]
MKHYHYHRRPTVLLLLLIVLVGILSCVVESQTIKSLTPESAFPKGGNSVTLLGNGFTSTPVLQLTNSLTTVDFKYISSTPSGSDVAYVFETPSEITTIASRKRGIDKSFQWQCPSANLPNTGKFIYYDFDISSVEPEVALVKSPTTDLPIISLRPTTKFIFQDSEVSLVTVTIGGVAATIDKIDRITGVMTVKVPSSTVSGEVDIVVSVFKESESIKFNYVDIQVDNSIHINVHGISASTPQTVTITGQYFKLLSGATTGMIAKIGPYQCASPTIGTSATGVSFLLCPLNTPSIPTDVGVGGQGLVPFYVKAGSYEYTSPNIIMMFNPDISSPKPNKGLTIGGDPIEITVTPIFAMPIVTIGTTNCLVTAKPTSTATVIFECLLPSSSAAGDKPITITINGVVRSLGLFTYYSAPAITSISPTTFPTLIDSTVTVTGTNLAKVNKLVVGTKDFVVDNVAGSDTQIIVALNGLVTASTSLAVFERTVTSNTIAVTVNQPQITSMTPSVGQTASSTDVVLVVSNFPTIQQPISTPEPEKFPIDVYRLYNTAENVFCEGLSFVVDNDYTKFKCKMPPITPGTGKKTINFQLSINGVVVTPSPTITFTYNEPSVTSLSNLGATGGDLTITGQSFIGMDPTKGDRILIGGKAVSTFTVVSDTSIVATANGISTLLGDDPETYNFGPYDLQLCVRLHCYHPTVQVNYNGPIVTYVNPSSKPKSKTATITIVGANFQSSSTVQVGTTACTGVAAQPDGRSLTCSLASSMPVGDVPVVVSQGTVQSENKIIFHNHGLRCLGSPRSNVGSTLYANDKSNDPVDWWFTYKLANSPTLSYMYADSSNATFNHKPYLSQKPTAADADSGLAATFLQYKDYKYSMFFNDQISTRSMGARSVKNDPTIISTDKFAHLKGFFIFDELNQGGIHVMHSNPLFPTLANKPASQPKYSFVEDTTDPKFLGAPTFNQHFFCYEFKGQAGLERVAEYHLKNNGYLMNNFLTTPKLPLVGDVSATAYPNLYDLLQFWGGWAPSGRKNQVQIAQHCVDNINATSLKDYCYWTPSAFDIGGMSSRFFEKTSMNPTTSFNPIDTPDGIVLNPGGHFDGFDLWGIVATTYDHRMFSEIFYKGQTIYPSTDMVKNSAVMELPNSIHGTASPRVKPSYPIKGNSNDHAKMAFSIYPTTDPIKMKDITQNIMCVGDSNRHGHQGIRGGGSLCFQNPSLSYQFNRMVKKYYQGARVGNENPETVGIIYSAWQKQPIKIERGNWKGDVYIEIKDVPATNTYTSKLPREFGVATEATRLLGDDWVGTYSFIRTSLDNVSTLAITPDHLVTATTDPDISTYVAAQTFSAHYSAYDKNVGSICFVSVASDPKFCDHTNAKQTLLPFSAVLPGFPKSYGVMNEETQLTQTFDIKVVDDFKTIKVSSLFKQHVSSKLLFNYVIDATATKPATFDGTYITKKTIDHCADELYYLMLLNHTYSLSKDKTKTLYTFANDDMNWANGILIAMAKFIRNEIESTPDNDIIDTCFSSLMPSFNITEQPIGDTTNIVIKHVSATWDFLSNTYRIKDSVTPRNPKTVQVTWMKLLEILSEYTTDDKLLSLTDIYQRVLDPLVYKSANYRTILINNYLMEDPALMIITPTPTKMPIVSSSSRSVDIFDSPLVEYELYNNLYNTESNTQQESNVQLDSSRVLVNDIVINDNTDYSASYPSPIEQLFKFSQLTFKKEQLLQLISNVQSTSKLLDAMNRWSTFTNLNQAIRVLVAVPSTQRKNQEIQFIDEVARDIYDLEIDLCYGRNESKGIIEMCSPQSITAITFFLDNVILTASQDSIMEYGALKVYNLPKPFGYGGLITADIGGMLVGTLDGLICDIKMYATNSIPATMTTLCKQAGPIVTATTVASSTTNGGQVMTVSGMNFDSNTTIFIGKSECLSKTVISDTQISCTIPPSSTSFYNLEVRANTSQISPSQLRSPQFNYLAPTLSTITPNTNLISSGGQMLTITGTNFGNSVANIQVLIENSRNCRVTSVSHTTLYCITPPSVGNNKCVHIVISNLDPTIMKSTKFNIDSCLVNNLSFKGPNITSVTGQDPNELVEIDGQGFDDYDHTLKPIASFNGQMVQVESFDNNRVQAVIPPFKEPPVNLQIEQQQLLASATFNYGKPYVTSVSTLKLGGGLFKMEGYGLGSSNYEIDYVRLDSTDISASCQSYNRYVECYIPGYTTSGQYILTASINGEVVLFQNNVTLDSNNITLNYGINCQGCALLFGKKNYAGTDTKQVTDTMIVKLDQDYNSVFVVPGFEFLLGNSSTTLQVVRNDLNILQMKTGQYVSVMEK